MKNIQFTYVLLFLILFFQPSTEAQIVRLKWMNFSPYTHSNQSAKDTSSIILDTQIDSLLEVLTPYTEGIRTFGTRYGLEKIPALAKAKGLKVILGIWLDTEDSMSINYQNQVWANLKQIESGIALANSGCVDRIIVGSEVLLRLHSTPTSTLNANKLIQYIEQVKQACPDTIPVSYADIYSELIANPDVLDVCDFLAPNIYPFWEGIPVECALQNFNQSYLSLLQLPEANGKEILISESGWRTSGVPNNGSSQPSLTSAIKYNRELLAWSKAFGVPVNIFSAFDEPWKLPNDDGWGIFFNNKIMKPGMDTLFTPFDIIDSTWLCMEINNLSTDTFNIDYLPIIGSLLSIEGHIDHLNPCNYKIATYINVPGNGWWTKPTFAEPTVPILCNGQWSVDYTTGGSDALATDICIFLVPCGYSPPLCGGCGSIPAEVYQNAIASNCIHRYELDSTTLTTAKDTICRGDTTTLTASGGSTYLWNTGETTASIQVSPEFNGTTYSVSISDGLGGGAIATITISVLSPTFYYLVSEPSIICLGDTSLLTPFTTEDVTGYLWSTGETTQTINVSPDSITTYTVTVSNSAGCTDTGVGIVYVYDYPPLIINASPDSICIGAYSSIQVYSGFVASYLWSTGASSSGAGSSTIHLQPTTTSAYTVTVTYDNGCSDVAQATVYVSPFPTVTVYAYPDTIQIGETATLTANGGTSTTFLWNTGETASSIQVSPLSTTTYLITVTNSTGCSTTDAVTVTVIPFVSTKNINKIKSIKIYPKPANEFIVVELKVYDPKFVEISLLNEMGCILEQHTERPIMGEIVSYFDVAFMSAGLYFLKLQTENGEVFTEKILKQ